MRLRSHEGSTPEYHIEHGSPGDAVKTLAVSKIISSDGEDAIVDEPKQRVAHLPALDSQRSSSVKKVAAGDGVRAPIVHQPSGQLQSTNDSPRQIQRTSPQAQQPPAILKQPVSLDLQREYNLVREHISRKDIASGLPAIASIAALRSCMTDLKDAAKMNSEAWFLMEREKIDEELVQAGFAGLPTV